MYLCKIKEHHGNQKYATKIRKTLSEHYALTKTALKETYAEFVLAKDLDHPNIIKYKHFVRHCTK